MKLLAAVAAMVLLCGCPSQHAAQPRGSADSPAEPRPSVALRVVVVNEPKLAEAVDRLRGEWAERFGGTLRVSNQAWDDLIAEKSADADLIVFPSRYVGELGARGWLRPVRQNVLASDDLRADDFWPLVRHELIQWGGETMALPLGVGRTAIGEFPGDEPALAWLALAANDAASKDRLGILFDIETMRPRISEAPFVDALTRLARSREGDAAPPGDSIPLLGYSDRLMAVTSSSRNAASAFKLLEWLARPEISSQIASLAGDFLPARESLASAPAWYDSGLSAGQRAAVARQLAEALDRASEFILPQIPGVDEYLAAAGAAVRAVVEDGAEPQAALNEASVQWDQITDARGRDAQRRAYLKHLGIAEP